MRHDPIRIPLLRLLARAVRTLSDERLERIFGSPFALWILFRGMAAAYQPQIVPGFQGALVFTVLRASETGLPERFTIDVFGLAAVARRGAPPNGGGDVHVEVTVPELVRIASGLQDPGRALIEGGVSADDFRLASMITEMFGAPRQR